MTEWEAWGLQASGPIRITLEDGEDPLIRLTLGEEGMWVSAYAARKIARALSQAAHSGEAQASRLLGGIDETRKRPPPLRILGGG